MWTTRRRTGKVVHASNIVPKRLAERVWCSKSQSSLLIIYFRSSGFQSSLLLIHFRYGPNTCSYYTEVLHRTYPIWDASLSRLAHGSFTLLQKSPCLGVNTSPMRYDFHFCRRRSHLVLCNHSLIHLVVITGLICGMLTHQYLAIGNEQEATQRNAGVKELHEEIFCDVVRTAFCLQLLKRLCQDSVLKSLPSVFPHTQNAPVELWRRYQTTFIRKH